MRDSDETMVERFDLEDAGARVLVMYFYGGLDAGGAGRMAVGQMMRSLSCQRVATFDSDAFIDYRSHRPMVTVEDWVTRDVDVPQITLERVLDDVGTPFLLLQGPEPDAKWDAFSRIVDDIAKRAGVEVTVCLNGIPSGVPHTRPTPVHVQATDASLVPTQPKLAQPVQFPAMASSYVQAYLADHGIEGISLLASVPFYMMETPCPAASSALITALADFADLSLPVGDLERGAAQDQGVIDSLIEANPDIMRTIESLEEHYDAWAGADGAIPLSALGQREGEGAPVKDAKDIGDVIEAYLANIARVDARQEERDAQGRADVDGTAEPTIEDPLEAALRRVEMRRRNPGGASVLSPSHRADTGDDADESKAESDEGEVQD